MIKRKSQQLHYIFLFVSYYTGTFPQAVSALSLPPAAGPVQPGLRRRRRRRRQAAPPGRGTVRDAAAPPAASTPASAPGIFGGLRRCERPRPHLHGSDGAAAKAGPHYLGRGGGACSTEPSGSSCRRRRSASSSVGATGLVQLLGGRWAQGVGGRGGRRFCCCAPPLCPALAEDNGSR